MGNAYLYYYPEDSGGIERIDLGQGLQTLDRSLVPLASPGRAIGGEVYPSPLGQFERMGATLRGITDEDLIAKLWSFERSRLNGRAWGFSSDHAKTWAGYVPRGLRRGTTVLRTNGNAYSAYSGSGALATGDYVVIESAYPESGYEMAKVSSVSGGTITLASALKYNYAQRPVLVRYYRFWPRLHSEDSRALISDEVPGFVWRLDVRGASGAAATKSASDAAPLLEGNDGPTKGGGKVTSIASGGRDPVRASDLGLPGTRGR